MLFSGKMLTRLSLVAAVLGFLSACQTTEVAGPPLLNGNWASSDGVYVAEFQNGNFRAIANDTGEEISRGEYVVLAENRVQLNWIGLVTNNANSAECNKPDPNRLDCIDRNGNRFSLARRG